nr:unnamed protein product [Callosobruchus chinensis]
MSGDCFRTTDFYLKIFGIWLESTTKSRMIVCILWDSLIFSIAFSFTTLEAIMINIKDLKLFFKVFGMFTAHVLESARFCNRFVTLTFLAYCLVGTSAHISALWRLNIEQHDTYFQGNSTCYDFLPYAFFIPFDDGSIRRCKTALFVMDFSYCIIASYIASYDVIFCCLLKCLDTNLQILSLTTKHIRERLLSRNSLSADYVELHDDSFPDFEEEMYLEIKKYNQNLEFLLRITNDIDGVFSLPMLLQCIASTFMMASNFFIASMLSPFDPEFYSLAEYMTAALAQLCMICHFGGIITETSFFYSRSLYECNWYSTSKRFKKCILIMMTRLQIPVMMTAGKFFPLTLATIISVNTFLPEKLMEESKIFCKRFVITLFVIYYMVGGTSHYSALKRLNEEQPYLYFQNASCYDFMPHHYMIPFETDTTSSCKMALVIMDLGMGVMGLYIAAYDALLTILLICLKTNLQILCEATRTIRERTLKRLNLSEHLGKFRDDEIPELENGMYVEIKKCNLHMVSLMRAHEDIEDTFCLVTLLQTASSLFMIASNLIIVSTLTPDNPLFWCIVQFIISCIIQLTMYCYFGSSITEMCYNYRRVVYECDWYSSSKRFKTCILIMMARMERPMYLTAGKFYPMTLNTAITYLDFVSALNGVPFSTYSTSIVKKVLVTIWGFILVAFCACFYCLEAMTMKNSVKESSVFFQQIGILVTAVVDVLKILVIPRRWKELLSIRLRLESDRFIYEPYRGFNPKKLLSSSNKFCKRLTAFLFSYYTIGISTHYSALSRLNLEQPNYYFQENTTCYDYLPYHYHIPFDTSTIGRCKYALIVMDIGMCIYIGYTMVYDNLFFYLLIYLQTYLKILTEATKFIRERTLTRLKLPAGYEIFRDEENPEIEKATYYEITKCCRHLQFLLRIQEDIEAIFTYITMLQTILTLSSLASNLYTLSMIPPSSADFLGLLVYTLLATVQLVMICHFGHRITEICFSLRCSLYECNWYSSSKRFKTCILLMMTRLQKPVRFTAGKFFPLTPGAVVTAMMMKNNVKELSVFFQQIGILISALVDILKLLAIAMHWKRLFSIRLRLESDEFQYEPYVYDNLFFALIIYLQTYLQILAEATKYIRERTLESLKLPADYDMFRDDENPALEKATYYEIRKCCRNLLFLLSSKFMTASKIHFKFICAYKLFTVIENLHCIILKNVVLLFQCFSLQRSVYECDWYSSSKRFKTCILLMMTRLQKPVCFTAGKFFPLTLGTVVLKVIITLWGVILLSFCICFYCLEAMTMKNNVKELSVFFQQIGILVSALVDVLKIMVIPRRWKELLSIRLRLESDKFQYEPYAHATTIYHTTTTFLLIPVPFEDVNMH